MFAMNGLFRYSKRVGNLLPRPSGSSSSSYLHDLESLKEAAERGYPLQTFVWVTACSSFGKIDCSTHAVIIC
jgi:hypothetical protein